MSWDLSTEDLVKYKRLCRLRKLNFAILDIYADLLNENPPAFPVDFVNLYRTMHKAELKQADDETVISRILEDISEDYKTPPCPGIDFYEDYICKSIKKLDTAQYKRNQYYKLIHLPPRSRGGWELKYDEYNPYELFPCGDVICTPDLMELPRIGFFTEKFKYPAVYENGVEWMAVKPNEIETMRTHIECARGNVLTLGLGLGYFAFMASQKPSVTSVTVIERDENIISLFREFILPQFPNKSKIRIIKSDALDYLDGEFAGESYNFVFADLWHDPRDGLDIYIEILNREYLAPETQFGYWIESTLLSHVRSFLFENIENKVNGIVGEDDFDFCDINSFDDILSALSDDCIRYSLITEDDIPTSDTE